MTPELSYAFHRFRHTARSAWAIGQSLKMALDLSNNLKALEKMSEDEVTELIHLLEDDALACEQTAATMRELADQLRQERL